MYMLNFGSFPGKVLFTVGFTYDEICKALKRQEQTGWLAEFETTKHNFDTEHCVGFCARRLGKDKCQYYFLHLRDNFNYTEKHHITLSHELIHLCSYHLPDYLDVLKENEAFAYTHSHLMQQCYDVMKQSKIRNKNIVTPIETM